MTSLSPTVNEIFEATLAELDPELRATMSRALHNAMNDPEIIEVRSDEAIEKAVMAEIAEYCNFMKSKGQTK